MGKKRLCPSHFHLMLLFLKGRILSFPKIWRRCSPLNLVQQGSVCIRSLMHIGIGLNLPLIPGLPEALLSECELSPAGVVGFTGAIGEERLSASFWLAQRVAHMGHLSHVHHISPNGFRQCRISDTGFSGFLPDSFSATGFPAEGKQDCCLHSCSHTLSLVQCWSRGLCWWAPFPISHSRWETLQACHKNRTKASSSPRRTFPLTLVEFESNLWSPMSLCWHYILLSLIAEK